MRFFACHGNRENNPPIKTIETRFHCNQILTNQHITRPPLQHRVGQPAEGTVLTFGKRSDLNCGDIHWCKAVRLILSTYRRCMNNNPAIISRCAPLLFVFRDAECGKQLVSWYSGVAQDPTPTHLSAREPRDRVPAPEAQSASAGEARRAP